MWQVLAIVWSTCSAVLVDPDPMVYFGSTCFCQTWDVVAVTSLHRDVPFLSGTAEMPETAETAKTLDSEVVLETVKCIRYRCPQRQINVANTSYGFPGKSQVVYNNVLQFLEDVNTGDFVRGCNMHWCRSLTVLGFDHRVSFARHLYLHIFVNNSDDSLIIAPSHYLLLWRRTSRDSELGRADSVVVGDWIHRSRSFLWNLVIEIRVEWHMGAYLPRTNGMLVVNGFDVYGGSGEPIPSWNSW